MGFFILGKQENIIYVNQCIVQEWLEQRYHCFLELGWAIFEAKRHDSPLIVVIWDAKRCFVSFFWMNSQLPKPCFQIELWEYFCIWKMLKECTFVWQGEFIICKEVIEILIINHQSEFSSDLFGMLINIKGFSCPWRGCWFNEAFGKEGGELLFG